MVFTAQPNGPRGLSPVRASDGTPNRANTYQIAGAGSDKFYSGQPLKIGDDGLIVKLAAAADTILGVFDGVEYVSSAGDVIFKPFWDAPGSVQTGSQVRARIYDNPFEQFLIFADADLTIDEVSGYFDFDTVAGTGGSDTTGLSSLSLDVSSENASAAGRSVVLRGFDVQRGRPGDLRSAIVQFVDPEFAAQIG